MNPLPNPISSSSWWQLVGWISDPISFTQRMSRKYGDTFTMNLGKLGSYVIVGNPQAIQEIFSQDSKQFDAGRGNELVKPLLGLN